MPSSTAAFASYCADWGCERFSGDRVGGVCFPPVGDPAQPRATPQVIDFDGLLGFRGSSDDDGIGARGLDDGADIGVARGHASRFLANRTWLPDALVRHLFRRRLAP
jgi:hypothetical protein